MGGIPALIMALWLTWALPSMQEIQTGSFLIHVTPQASVYGDYLREHSEQLRRYIEHTTGLSENGRVSVVLVRTAEEFQKVQPQGAHPPIWARGVAYPDKGLIIIKTQSLASMTDFKQVFLHEYAHILLGRVFTDHPIPVWLHEGLAMRFSGEWSLSRIVSMSQAVMADRIIPLSELVTSFPQDEQSARIAYVQSYYVISFFQAEFGTKALGRFLKDYGRGFGFENALYRATGMKMSQFDKQWERFIRLRFSWIPIGASTGTLWFGAAILFLTAYIRKRRRARKILEAWDKEEAGMDPDEEQVIEDHRHGPFAGKYDSTLH